MGEYGGIFDYLVPLVLVLTVMLIGFNVMAQVSKSKSFEKRYTMEDLRLLKHSILSTGSSGDIIFDYNGVKGSYLEVTFDKDTISVAEVRDEDDGTVSNLIPVNTFTVSLIDDTKVESTRTVIPPDTRYKDTNKYAAEMYMGKKQSIFFVKAP